MTSRTYKLITRAALVSAALGVTAPVTTAVADNQAWTVTQPTTAAPAPTAPPGPQNPQARPDWWTVTKPTVRPVVHSSVPVEPSAPAPRVTHADPSTHDAAPAPVAQHAPRAAHVVIHHRRGVRHVTTGGRTWPVRRGQTLTLISQETGVTIVDIVRANGIVNRNMIYAGETLTIPAGTR